MTQPADYPPDLIDRMAVVISGAPHPSTRSRNKARAILDLLQAETEAQDAAIEARANETLRKTGLRGIDVEPGGMVVHLAPPGDLIAVMATALAEHLEGVENYTETAFILPPAAADDGPPEGAPSASWEIHAAHDPQWYVLTVQRKWAKTPHELRRIAEAERDKFSNAVNIMHAQQLRTESERDALREELRQEQLRHQMAETEAANLRADLDLASAEAEDAREGGLGLALELADANADRDRLKAELAETRASLELLRSEHADSIRGREGR